MTIAPCSPVLLYHSVTDDLPAGWDGRIHNVRPEDFRAQIRWLKRRYRLVDMAEWVAARWRSGLATITFDDGYRSVFERAFPILREEAVPATVFVNGGLSERGEFWRDGIRRLAAAGQVESFLEWLRATDGHDGGIAAAGNFYRATKDPTVNSAWIAERVDRYLRVSGGEVAEETTGGLLATPTHFVDDPLLSYGNHTWSHFVLSSLSAAEQETEIRRNADWIRTHTPRPVEMLAFPFGGSRDVDTETFRLARATGHRAVLYSRQRLNFRRQESAGMAVGERLMAPAGGAQPLRRTLYRIGVRQLRGAS